MWKLAIIMLSAGLLSACSTSDVLTVNDTPPAPVGDSAASVPPASQTPASTLAAAQQGTVERQNLSPPPSGSASQTANEGTTTLEATPGRGRPPSTFGAQVSGLNPQPAQTVTTQQTATTSQPAVAAASTAQPVAPAQPAPAAAQPNPPATASATTQATPAPQTASTTTGTATAYDTIRFLPLIGAPSEKLQPLSERLGQSARASGLTITRMDDDTASLSLKGYFSAVTQDNEVQVVYVWDVIGTEGNRLHRIQGSEAGPAVVGASDPWESVTSTMMTTVGQNSISTLINWIDTQN